MLPQEKAGTDCSQPVDLVRVDSHNRGLAFVAALEEIRNALRSQLDALEAVARDRTGLRPATEAALRKQVDDLEDQCARLGAENERLKHERNATLGQLEHDRMLLAEAWERLEQAEVKRCATPADSPRPAPFVSLAVRELAAPITSGEDDPVARAVLQQFRSLQRDVRRNVEMRKVD